MATEYKLSYTASQIDEKLGKIDSLATKADVNNALAQAKASGEFDGISVTHSWNGTTLVVTSASGTSSQDLKGDSGKSAYSHARDGGYTGTEAEFNVKLAELVGYNVVIGTIGDDNVITLSSNLEQGTYKLMYENASGVLTEGGSIEIKLEAQAQFTNQITISTDADGNVYGYATDTYLSSSSGGTSTKTGYEYTGFIPVKIGDVVRMQGVGFNKTASDTGYHRMCFYDSSKSFIGFRNVLNMEQSVACDFDSSGNLIQFTLAVYGSYITSDVAYMRLCCPDITDESIITVNEEIVYA